MVVLTVGGPPGSGTSTLCRLLHERTGLRYVYAGEIFRNMARERGMTLLQFSALCKADPSVDYELDLSMLREARVGDAILEGRMIGPLCAREKIHSLKIYVDADPNVRANRVRERDGGVIEDVMRTIKERETLERERYMKFYGLDPSERSCYDIYLDSTEMAPDRVLEIVMEKAQVWSC